MPKVYLDDAIYNEARDKMRSLMHAEDDKGLLVQLRAADAIMKACQMQERYTLRPQNADDYARAVIRRGSAAKALEDMTPEELFEYQRQMLGGDFPGEPV